MKLQLITDLNDELVAVQLPVEEYLRLKQAAGEPIIQFGKKVPEPKPENPEPETIEEGPVAVEPVAKPTPTIRSSSSIAEILGRDPDEEYKHYTHEIEGAWLGIPKRGQRTGTGSYYTEKEERTIAGPDPEQKPRRPRTKQRSRRNSKKRRR